MDTSRNQDLDVIRNKIVNINNSLATKKQSLVEKINELGVLIDNNKSQITSKEQTINDLQKEILTLRSNGGDSSKVAELEENLRKKEMDLNNKVAEIGDLKGKMDALESNYSNISAHNTQQIQIIQALLDSASNSLDTNTSIISNQIDDLKSKLTGEIPAYQNELPQVQEQEPVLSAQPMVVPVPINDEADEGVEFEDADDGVEVDEGEEFEDEGVEADSFADETKPAAFGQEDSGDEIDDFSDEEEY
jgi:hypothetical protein